MCNYSPSLLHWALIGGAGLVLAFIGASIRHALDQRRANRRAAQFIQQLGRARPPLPSQ